MDRRMARFEERWSFPWRYFAALKLGSKSAWLGEQDLTREAVFALTLEVQQWLASEPALSKTSVVVKALKTVRRVITGQRREQYEVLELLRHAGYEETADEALLLVRGNLVDMFGERAVHLSDQDILAAMVLDQSGHVEAGKTWKPIINLLRELGVRSGGDDSIQRSWRAILVEREVRPREAASRPKRSPDP
jgi:hypothetical protein